MKRIKYLLLGIFLVFFMVGCELNLGNNTTPTEQNAYTVTVMDEEGVQVEVATVNTGEAYIPRNNPPAGYYYDYGTFNDALTAVNGDLTVTRYLVEMDRIIRYYIDGELYAEYNGKYFDPIVEPTLPEYMDRVSWQRKVEKITSSKCMK